MSTCETPVLEPDTLRVDAAGVTQRVIRVFVHKARIMGPGGIVSLPIREVEAMRSAEIPATLKKGDFVVQGDYFCLVTGFQPFGNLGHFVKLWSKWGFPDSYHENCLPACRSTFFAERLRFAFPEEIEQHGPVTKSSYEAEISKSRADV